MMLTYFCGITIVLVRQNDTYDSLLYFKKTCVLDFQRLD